MGTNSRGRRKRKRLLEKIIVFLMHRQERLLEVMGLARLALLKREDRRLPDPHYYGYYLPPVFLSC